MIALQHRIASGIVLLVSVWVFWISFSQTPADAYLFPRVISVVFVALAAWTFVKALERSSTGPGGGLSLASVRNFLPGLLLAGLYVFFAAKSLGFYAASSLAFLGLLSLYDPAPHGAFRTWARRLIITAGYIAVMYLLFSVVLKVFTPRGLFL